MLFFKSPIYVTALCLCTCCSFSHLPSSHTSLWMVFVKSRWVLTDSVHLHHRKHFVHRHMCCQSPRYLFFFGIRREILLSSVSNLALGALLHCNSFTPQFCLTQHIIWKWIFKDLHIYITEFLSLKFSKSAKFCPEYVNFLLVSRSWEHSDGEHFAVDSEVKH